MANGNHHRNNGYLLSCQIYSQNNCNRTIDVDAIPNNYGQSRSPSPKSAIKAPFCGRRSSQPTLENGYQHSQRNNHLGEFPGSLKSIPKTSGPSRFRNHSSQLPKLPFNEIGASIFCAYFTSHHRWSPLVPHGCAWSNVILSGVFYGPLVILSV